MKDTLEGLPETPLSGVGVTEIRTFLCPSVYLSNGHRPGVLCNMKLKFYMDKKEVINDEKNITRLVFGSKFNEE